MLTTEKTTNILVDSGLAFEVEKRPLFIQRFGREGDTFEKSGLSAGVFRTDTGQQIGNVTPSYAVAQNAEVLRPFLEATKSGHLNYLHGRTINEGSRFCLTFDIDGGLDVGNGEDLRRRIVVGGSHDGTWSTFIKTFVWRQICSNGLMGFGIKDCFRVRHTKNWKNAYDNVLRTLEATDKFFVEAMAKYRNLFDIRLSHDQAVSLTNKLLEIKPGETTSGRKRNQKDAILRLTRNGRGIRGNDRIQNTAAAWYNAVAEYVDHYSASDSGKRYVSAYFGGGETRKKKAFELAMSV